MKLLSVLHVSPKKVGDDKKSSPVHKAWENANIAQLACDEAKGWEACKDIVADDASFSCQCKTFEHMTTVKEYVDWCEGFGKICPGATFTVRFKTFDEATSTAIFICTYHATHTGEGGPVDKPTNKSTDSDYVYMLKFNNEDKVESMHKTWNDTWAIKELGWS